MSEPNNREVRPGVIYGGNDLWKGVFWVWGEREKGVIDGESGDSDENGDLAWPKKCLGSPQRPRNRIGLHLSVTY